MAKVLLLDVLRDYLSRRDIGARTEKTYAGTVLSFQRWLGRKATADDLDLANAYIAFRIQGGEVAGEPVKGSKMTAASHRGVLLMLMRHAVRRKWRSKCVIKPIRRPRVIPHALMLAELGKLLQFATPRQRAAIWLCMDTGYRRADLFAAKWSQVSKMPAGFIVSKVVEKTGRVETRLLRPETMAALEAIRKPHNDALLPGPRSRTNWTKRWQLLGARAGIDVRKRGLQAVRRAGASYVKANGGDAKKYLGHTSDGLAERYYLDPRIVNDLPDLPPPPSWEE